MHDFTLYRRKGSGIWQFHYIEHNVRKSRSNREAKEVRGGKGSAKAPGSGCQERGHPERARAGFLCLGEVPMDSTSAPGRMIVL